MGSKFALHKAQGQNYLEFLGDLHKHLTPDWYLEIGTQTGKSLAMAECNSVAVDPNFVLKRDVIASKNSILFFQEKSDSFFDGGFLHRLGEKIDVAFLDGMHLYEFMLRDFSNSEKHMTPDGTIVLHNCLPFDTRMAGRDRRKAPTRAWCGDVWKVVAILKEYRPELNVQVYDAAPTGMVVVQNLDPKNKTLDFKYDEIIRKYDKESDVAAYMDDLNILPTAQAPWNNPGTVDPEDAQKKNFVIQIPAPNRGKMKNWGDYYFAVGLADALTAIGHNARIQPRNRWHVSQHSEEIDIVIRGRARYQKRGNNRTIYWVISGGKRVPQHELDAADYVFAASSILTADLTEALGSQKVAMLLQAFDAKQMKPPQAGLKRDGVAFVGICRTPIRPIVGSALQAGVKPMIWGPGWKGSEAEDCVVAERVENDRLFEIYSTAEIVLNDQTPPMTNSGLISNRIFDALSCGAAVITTPIPGLPDDIAKFVEQAANPEEFRAAYDKISSETGAQKEERVKFALHVRETHSFDCRAKQMLAALELL